jgi:hypothetical protein
VFTARHLGAEGVLALLRRLFMLTEILDQSPLYRRWIAEGKAEGEAAGMRQAALAALRSRWGELPADVEAAAGAATKETLLDMVAHVATDTQEQMRARLGL